MPHCHVPSYSESSAIYNVCVCMLQVLGPPPTHGHGTSSPFLKLGPLQIPDIETVSAVPDSAAESAPPWLANDSAGLIDLSASLRQEQLIHVDSTGDLSLWVFGKEEGLEKYKGKTPRTVDPR